MTCGYLIGQLINDVIPYILQITMSALRAMYPGSITSTLRWEVSGSIQFLLACNLKLLLLPLQSKKGQCLRFFLFILLVDDE